MTQGVSESVFSMWRTVFALAHVDHVVTSEEIRFMAEAIEDVKFSDEQRHLLTVDIASPRDPVEMFGMITEQKDRLDFFEFAYKMVWADGHYVEEEQDVVHKLRDLHMQDVNVDELVGKIDLELEEDQKNPGGKTEDHIKNVKGIIASFKEKFRA
ncbi:MAG: hypothetical protein DHS20C02_10700 [Micavibrio sp.]|nr:MAG: hypothetical protein DHS20C02_10700 [Micavibrio sp.]